jgi:hypothetical protein
VGHTIAAEVLQLNTAAVLLVGYVQVLDLTDWTCSVSAKEVRKAPCHQRIFAQKVVEQHIDGACRCTYKMLSGLHPAVITLIGLVLGLLHVKWHPEAAPMGQACME